MKAVARQVVSALAGWDALLTPALAARPLPIGDVHGLGPDPMGHFRRSGLFTPYTAIVNVTGLPGHLAAAVRGRGRPAERGPARRPRRSARGRCWRWRRRSRRRRRGRRGAPAP